MWHDANKGEGVGQVVCIFVIFASYKLHVTIAILQLSIHLHSTPIYGMIVLVNRVETHAHSILHSRTILWVK